MKRRLTILSFALILSMSACCNITDNDSNKVWKEIDAGIFKCYNLTYNNDSLFGAPQNIYYIVVPKENTHLLSFAYDTLLTQTSEQAARIDAMAAINGSDFDMTYGNPVCYLRINDTMRGINVPATPVTKYNSKKKRYVVVREADTVHRKYYQYAAIVIDKGKISIIVPDSARRYEETLPQSNIMTAGPMLIKDGKKVKQRTNKDFVNLRHNRTALGLRADSSVVLLTADGRFSDKADGLSLPELAHIMDSIGCVDAINLDGGGSTTMYLNPSINPDVIYHTGVLNYPSDNMTFDHEGERHVSNIIVINKPKDKSINNKKK